MAQKRFEEACREFATSQELDPGAGTMLNLGYCYEKLGKTASAWATYREAAAAAQATGKTDWENGARERVAYLEASLLRVVIEVSAQAAGGSITVLVDGAPFPQSVWGQAVPLYPGQHEVRVKAIDRRTWTTTFEVNAEHLPTVTVPVLDPIAPLSVVTEQEQRHFAVEARAGEARRTAALALGGAGVIALGVASGFALASITTYHDAQGQCETIAGNRACTGAGADATSRAHTEWNLAAIAATTGGAAILGGAILWFTGASNRRGIQIQATIERQTWGTALRGTW